MNYQIIPMEDYPRKAHFAYFSAMVNPYAGLTVQVDITDFMERVKREALPFFLSLLYCAGRAANRVPQLRQRILDGQIAEFSHCPTSHTVALEDETYCYCVLDHDKPFSDYLPYAQAAVKEAKARRSTEDGEDALSLLFVSSLPWLSYEDIHHPTPSPADSNPRITWGKYRREGERVKIPVSILVHHALVDGLHIAKFYGALEEELAAFAAEK